MVGALKERPPLLRYRIDNEMQKWGLSFIMYIDTNELSS